MSAPNRVLILSTTAMVAYGVNWLYNKDSSQSQSINNKSDNTLISTNSQNNPPSLNAKLPAFQLSFNTKITKTILMASATSILSYSVYRLFNSKNDAPEPKPNKHTVESYNDFELMVAGYLRKTSKWQIPADVILIIQKYLPYQTMVTFDIYDAKYKDCILNNGSTFKRGKHETHYYETATVNGDRIELDKNEVAKPIMVASSHVFDTGKHSFDIEIKKFSADKSLDAIGIKTFGYYPNDRYRDIAVDTLRGDIIYTRGGKYSSYFIWKSRIMRSETIKGYFGTLGTQKISYINTSRIDNDRRAMEVVETGDIDDGIKEHIVQKIGISRGDILTVCLDCDNWQLSYKINGIRNGFPVCIEPGKYQFAVYSQGYCCEYKIVSRDY